MVNKVLAELSDVHIGDLTLEGLQSVLVVTDEPLAVTAVRLLGLDLSGKVQIGLLGLPQEGAEAI